MNAVQSGPQGSVCAFGKIGHDRRQTQGALVPGIPEAGCSHCTYRHDFEEQVVPRVLAGGLSTEEILNRMQPVQDSIQKILDLAMSIEARALDLYQRAADRQPDKDGQVIQQQTVDEERSHLVQLCRLLEQVS